MVEADQHGRPQPRQERAIRRKKHRRGEVAFSVQFHWPKGRVEDGPLTKEGFGVTGKGYGIVDFPEFVYHDYGDLEIRVLRESEVQNATLLTVMPKIED